MSCVVGVCFLYLSSIALWGGAVLEGLNGIHLALLSPSIEESGSGGWLNFFNAQSSNDSCFDGSITDSDVAFLSSGERQIFLPFAQAVAPEIWKIIATWLAAGSQRSLRVKIGEAELEANSLADLIDLLNRALSIYDSGQKI